MGSEADTGRGNRWKSEPGDMTYEQTVRTLMGLNSRASEAARSGLRLLRLQHKSEVWRGGSEGLSVTFWGNKAVKKNVTSLGFLCVMTAADRHSLLFGLYSRQTRAGSSEEYVETVALHDEIKNRVLQDVDLILKKSFR